MSISLDNKFYTISNIDNNGTIKNIAVDVRDNSLDADVSEVKGFWFNSDDDTDIEAQGYDFLKARDEFAGATDV